MKSSRPAYDRPAGIACRTRGAADVAAAMRMPGRTPLNRSPRLGDALVRVIVAAALLLWGLANSALAANEKTAAAPAKVEAAVTGVVQSFVAAWNRNDTSALTDLFAPNGTLQTPSGATAQGRQQIRQLLTKEHDQIYKGTTLIANATQVKDAATATPVVSGSYTLKGVDVALWIDVAVEGTFVFRFVRRGKHWLIASARISRQ